MKLCTKMVYTVESDVGEGDIGGGQGRRPSRGRGGEDVM